MKPFKVSLETAVQCIHTADKGFKAFLLGLEWACYNDKNKIKKGPHLQFAVAQLTPDHKNIQSIEMMK